MPRTSSSDAVIALQGCIEAETAPRAQILATLANQYSFTCLVPPTHRLVAPRTSRPVSIVSAESDQTEDTFATAPETFPPVPTVALELDSYLGSGSLFDAYTALVGEEGLIVRILDPALGGESARKKAVREAELYAGPLKECQGQLVPRFYGLWHGRLEDMVRGGERELLVMVLEDCGARLEDRTPAVRDLARRVRRYAEVSGDVYTGLPRERSSFFATDGGGLRMAGFARATPKPRPIPRRPPPPPPRPKEVAQPPSPPSPKSPPPPEPSLRTFQPLPDQPVPRREIPTITTQSPDGSVSSRVSSRPSIKFPDRPASMPAPMPQSEVDNRFSVLTFNQGATAALQQGLRSSSPHGPRSSSPPRQLVPELALLDVSVMEPEERKVRKKSSWIKTKTSIRSLRIWKRKDKEKEPSFEMVA